MPLFIGTAGWTIPRASADAFHDAGTSLERYAARFDAVEINSSFHRPHRASTWQRWADSVPPHFRFAVKLPKTISHQHKLVDCSDLLARFLEDVAPLGDKLAILLLQLPPKLAFDVATAEPFLAELARSGPAIAFEPRHPSWFDPDADALLQRLGIARVAADPAVVPAAALPGGSRSFAYLRLHGSPRMYRSSYEDDRLAPYAELIRAERAEGRPVWCMFDNTASGAATGDALRLAQRL